MKTTLLSKPLSAALTILITTTMAFPAIAHDCKKDHSSMKEQKAEHMKMKDGKGHMGNMQMHEKMMGKMKACMAEKMENDSEQDPEKLRHNMMGHMEMCMSSMKPSDEKHKEKGAHEHGKKKEDKKHSH